ncbi:MAG: neutral/alkaline non-lysosomal ceramidase N-terminal domain-containing protein, partial [Verrucomicrobia bacterium]|nr:neutral/alkaline non-lysosomal ceramidase N-terminal domain-containing protein [Verrucomicrobiota bacterium]
FGMNVGIAVADITPVPGFTLSGFVARRNQPSEGVHDALSVRCVAVRDGGKCHLLFSFDLLGIGPELLQQLEAALAKELGRAYSRRRTVFCATHTHSAPATVRLEGCGIFEPIYWRQIRRATLQAAQQAIDRCEEGALWIARREIKDLQYNRRRVLANGRVSLAQFPKEPVVWSGPVDPLLTIGEWRSPGGKPLAAMIHFSAHPICSASLQVTADYPGELRRLLEAQIGASCIFLQGASADLNPMSVAQAPAEALQYARMLMSQLDGVRDEMKPVASGRFRATVMQMSLRYQRGQDLVRLKKEMEQFERMARGESDSPSVANASRKLADLMNRAPGEPAEVSVEAFSAHVLAQACRRSLRAMQKGNPPCCPLLASVWDFGGLALLFANAELFASTGLCLRKLSRKKTCLPVGYAAPVAGYIPPRESLAQGGYEVEHAWRFYGHPAPFDPAAEEKVRQVFRRFVL